MRDIASENRRVVYAILMKAAAETTLQIAADPKRLGARIALTSVLHTWGSALTHHPHVHMIVPGGGLSPDGERWIASRGNFLVHVGVLSHLFSGKVLAKLKEAHAVGRMQFFDTHAGLADCKTFKRFLGQLHRDRLLQAAVRRSGTGSALPRCTHGVALSDRRLISTDNGNVALRWKDYRIEGPRRWKTMSLTAGEFIRRFLIHVLPKGFQRIRHYGLFANAHRADAIARARKLLAVSPLQAPSEPATGVADEKAPRVWPTPCPYCGKRLLVIEVIARGTLPRHHASPPPIPRRDHIAHPPPSCVVGDRRVVDRAKADFRGGADACTHPRGSAQGTVV